jgi:hypothetical protein
MSEDNPSAAVTGGASEGSAATEGAGNASNVEAGTIAKTLSEVLGRDFQDDASALKSVKDTYKMVGAVGQIKKTLDAAGLSEADALTKLTETSTPQSSATPSDVTSEIAALRDQLEVTQLVSERPELRDHLDLLNKLRAPGQTLRAAAESEDFKGVFDKIHGYDEIQKSKSVLESSPRLGRVKDKMQEAKQSLKDGQSSAANRAAVSAVIDALDLRK